MCVLAPTDLPQSNNVRVDQILQQRDLAQRGDRHALILCVEPHALERHYPGVLDVVAGSGRERRDAGVACAKYNAVSPLSNLSKNLISALRAFRGWGTFVGGRLGGGSMNQVGAARMRWGDRNPVAHLWMAFSPSLALPSATALSAPLSAVSSSAARSMVSGPTKVCVTTDTDNPAFFSCFQEIAAAQRRRPGRRGAASAAPRSGAWRRAAPPQAGFPSRV